MQGLTSAFAPGRIELLGNHTDYNEGLVLGAAIDRGLTVSGVIRNDAVIELSSDLMGTATIRRQDLRPQATPAWVNYPLGVVQELLDLGIAVNGFEARITGTLPGRTGLSSSAALEVATAFFVLKIHRAELANMELAKLCQRAEHRFVGVQSGLLDQVVSIFGRAHHLVLFDARSEQVRLIPFPAGLALIVASSGQERELSRENYNSRREQTAEAARVLKVRALRDVSSADLEARVDIDPVLKKRARHIVGENERVERAIDLLESGEAKAFGQLMNESHESSRHNFENSTAALDLLVKLARDIPGVLGARLTGAGFGGAIVVLCRGDDAEVAARRLREDYLKETGISAEMFVCEVGDGARGVE